MTLSQADNINKQFTKFKDSINSINKKNNLLVGELGFKVTENKTILDSLTRIYDSMVYTRNKMIEYRKEKDDALIYAKEVKRDFRVNGGLGFIALSIFAIIVTLMK